MRGLIVIGAGGHGRVVADAAHVAGWSRVGLLDDREQADASPFEIIGTVGKLDTIAEQWDAAIAAVGDNATRLAFLRRAIAAGLATPALVHPAAAVSAHAELGNGVFVAAGAVVNIGASIGEATIINTSATIDHDCRLGPAVHVSPGANLGGNVTVGPRSWIGIGASVRNGVTIGSDVIVGAGSVVIRDIADGETVVGVPARSLDRGRTGEPC